MSDKIRLVVGVGASAGGLDAFRRLLGALKADSGMAFILVQHLDPSHQSMLRELLASHSKMTIVDAVHGRSLEPDHVYVIQPDTSLAIEDGKIALSAPVLRRGVRLPVDHLFRSLAEEYGPRAAALVLSGSGSDGSAGLRALHEAGGLVIAQEPSTCGQRGMPQSAIDTGAVDLIVPIEEMPSALERFVDLGASPEKLPQRDDLDDQLQRLTALLNAQIGFDLSVYKPGTVERRLARRVGLSGSRDLDAYIDDLRENRVERQTLVRDLLINVTDFFRDPDSFEALRATVVSDLVARSASHSTLRAWVAGCATGEEAYSVAICLLEEILRQGRDLEIQLFATDLDAEALAVARAGVYPASIAERMGEAALSTYFTPLGDKGFRVQPHLRDRVSFAVHDLVKDPPFSRMDLVTCRNVLIYLTSDAQRHVLASLHFALKADAHLFLGTSESTGAQREHFRTVSKPHRIYRKVGQLRASVRPRLPPTTSRQDSASEDEEPDRPWLTQTRSDADLARRVVLESWVPPSIVVAGDGSIMFMHGELSPYLKFPEGDAPTLDIASVLRPSLSTRARGAIYRCRRNGEELALDTSPAEGRGKQVRVTAKPAPELGDDAVILSFQDTGASPAAPTLGAEPDETVVAQLEKELNATREDLSNTVEELETSNEELRSANEESMSMNEELQSANEELEATSEELRSLNEELSTVNVQLREKIEQLESAHDDLHNFFHSARVATVFLDERLRVKRFTPTAGEMLRIDSSDEGRYVGDFVRDLLGNELEVEARSVLDSLAERSCEVRTDDGRWIARRVLPYRTHDRRIEGVVVTFVDVTEIKESNAKLALRERQQSVVARLGLQALREPRLDVLMEHAVREIQDTLETDYSKVLELQPGEQRLLLRAGAGWRPGLVGEETVDTEQSSQAGYTLRSPEPVVVVDLVSERRFQGPSLLTDHGVTSGISCVIRDGESAYGVLGAHTRDRRHFTVEDTLFMQAVANVIGAGVGRVNTRRRLMGESRVSAVLAEARSLDDALESVLEGLCEAYDCSVAEAWFGDTVDSLSRRSLLISRAKRREVVEADFAEADMGGESGLVGHAYRDGSALWCTDLGDLRHFARHAEARAAGLRSGFAFPVVAAGRTVGVITLFSEARIAMDRATLSSLEGIGRELGSYTHRVELEQRARSLAAISESSHDSILRLDLDGRILQWLPGAEALYGRKASETVGEDYFALVPTEEHDAVREILASAHTDDMAPPVEGTRLDTNGQAVHVSVRLSVIRDAAGEAVGFAVTERDVTELKATERKLLEANEHKDEFLAMLGHELRNPLAAIRGASEVLALIRTEDARLRRTRDVLGRQTAHMAKLIDGLLDVSRIIRGKIEISRAPVDLAAICATVVNDARDRSSSRGVTLRTEFPAVPTWVDADVVRITQVVDNLVSNAVKYSDESGEVWVRVERDGTEVVLKVQDSGIGIEPELLPHVFEVFRQSKQSLDRSGGGLGLGLSLVKALVELHGGKVEARSEGLGEGATFSVRLPRREAPATGEHPRPLKELGPCKVLLIEDNLDAADMMAQYLEHMGHQVAAAHDGVRGLEAVSEFEPDVVVCDIGLPGGMSGYDVAQAVRALPGHTNLPMVALSGYGRPEDKQRAREAGFDEHLTKPTDGETLSAVLTAVRQRR